MKRPAALPDVMPSREDLAVTDWSLPLLGGPVQPTAEPVEPLIYDQLRREWGDIGETVSYIATCEDCQPAVPQPFTDPEERFEWAEAHRETGHTVRFSRERS